MATKERIKGPGRPGRRPSLNAEHTAVLRAITQEQPRSSLDEVTRELLRRTGARVSTVTVRKALREAGIDRLKPIRRVGERAAQGSARARYGYTDAHRRSDGVNAYIAASGMPSTLQDLANHDCVSAAPSGGRASWRFTGPDGVEEDVQVTGRFMADTAQALRKATLAGLGIARLPPSMAGLDMQAGLLVPVLPQYRRKGHGLNVLYPSRRQLPLAVSAFIELVTEKLGTVEALPAALRSGRS